MIDAPMNFSAVQPCVIPMRSGIAIIEVEICHPVGKSFNDACVVGDTFTNHAFQLLRRNTDGTDLYAVMQVRWQRKVAT
jgi:hypothetical protein